MTIKKQMIAGKLVELLEHKPVDKITVKELVDACNISRQTFYYHFQDIMDVVEWYQDQILKRSIERSLEAPTFDEAIRGVVQETYERRELISQLMASQRWREVEVLFLKAVRTYLRELFRGKGSGISCAPADLEAVLSFYTCGLVGMMFSGLKQKDPDLDLLSGQMCRLLTGEISCRFGNGEEIRTDK